MKGTSFLTRVTLHVLAFSFFGFSYSIGQNHVSCGGTFFLAPPKAAHKSLGSQFFSIKKLCNIGQI